MQRQLHHEANDALPTAAARTCSIELHRGRLSLSLGLGDLERYARN